jgi:hypothetical protein
MSAEYEAALEIRATIDSLITEIGLLRDKLPDRRERIATAMAAGLFATTGPSSHLANDWQGKIVRNADRLIEALDASQPKKE